MTDYTLLQLYKDIEEQLLYSSQPSAYLNKIVDTPAFAQSPFDMLQQLKKTKQSLKYHPEGNVWNHTMMVLDEAAKRKDQSKNPRVLMWAALLHDIGKPVSTRIRNGKITSYNHDKEGARMAEDFLIVFSDDKTFVQDVCNLILYHMQILFVIKHPQFADISGMKNSTDINEVALLGLCDRMGRLNSVLLEEEQNIHLFLKKCE